MVPAIITHNRGITFFSRKLLVSQFQKFSWESLQCLEKFRVSKNFMHNTGYHVLPSKIPCLKVLKIFVGIPSMFQKNSGIEKKLWILGVSKLSDGNCLSHSAESFCEGVLHFLRKFWFRKLFTDKKGGLSHISIEIFWSLSTENLREHPCNVSEKLWYRKYFRIVGGITFFCRKFHVWVCQKNVDISSLFQKS